MKVNNFRRRRLELAACLSGLGLMLILVYHYIFFVNVPRDFPFDPFVYPLRGNVTKYVNQLRLGNTPDVPPINSYNYSFLLSNDSKCLDSDGNPDKIHLLILIKSAMTHRTARRTIRKTWGQEDRYSRTKIRVVFLLGVNPQNKEFQERIEIEFNKYGDIIQSNFTDTYYNNTIKTMQGMKWVVEKCKYVKFILFSDDDMYVSIRYLLNLTYSVIKSNLMYEDDYLYVGRVNWSQKPGRDPTGKWFISLQDYPYTTYPPFISAGAFVVNHKTILQLFYGSMYTEHMKFDDVFLSIVAQKVNIPMISNANFLVRRNYKYNKHEFKSVIAYHGFNPKSSFKAWREQRRFFNT